MKTLRDTRKMVQLAVLVAIIVLMSFTPLGFVPIGPVTIAITVIPVAIAAIVIGPVGGAVAGGVFGFCAFLRILFGLSPFFALFLNYNPFFTFVLMVVPRVLCGLLAGYAHSLAQRFLNRTLAAAAASLTAPLVNTILFVSTWILLFGNTDTFVNAYGRGFLIPFAAIISINAPIEAAVCLIVGVAVGRTLIHVFPGNSGNKGLA